MSPVAKVVLGMATLLACGAGFYVWHERPRPASTTSTAISIPALPPHLARELISKLRTARSDIRMPRVVSSDRDLSPQLRELLSREPPKKPGAQTGFHLVGDFNEDGKEDLVLVGAYAGPHTQELPDYYFSDFYSDPEMNRLGSSFCAVYSRGGGSYRPVKVFTFPGKPFIRAFHLAEWMPHKEFIIDFGVGGDAPGMGIFWDGEDWQARHYERWTE